MSIFLIVFLLLLGLIAVLAIGGAVAGKRRFRNHAAELDRQIEQANHKLALARAGDKGWNPDVIERKARESFQQAYLQNKIEMVDLIQVVDHEGTDNDQAVMRIVTEEKTAYRMVLGRRNGEWLQIELQEE